jgi:hypothetical protein
MFSDSSTKRATFCLSLYQINFLFLLVTDKINIYFEKKDISSIKIVLFVIKTKFFQD